MAEKPNKDEIIDIEFKIKKMIAESGISMSECVRLMNERYDTKDVIQNFARQVREGNMPIWKLNRLASTLGYDINFQKK